MHCGPLVLVVEVLKQHVVTGAVLLKMCNIDLGGRHFTFLRNFCLSVSNKLSLDAVLVSSEYEAD